MGRPVKGLVRSIKLHESALVRTASCWPRLERLALVMGHMNHGRAEPLDEA